MKKILVSWVGMRKDESTGGRVVNRADLERVLSWEKVRFDTVVLLFDAGYPQVEDELEQIALSLNLKLSAVPVKLHDPNDHEELFTSCSQILNETFRERPDHKRYFYITPGTAAMHAVWLFLAKTRFAPARLIHAPRNMEPREINVPFEISVDLVPGIFHRTDDELLILEPDIEHSPASFKNIITRSPEMKEVLDMAKILAKRSIPILLDGETGTGKSLLARTIHAEGTKKKGPFIQLNCGGLPESLVESELFGIEEKVATGVGKREGVFEQAHGGTLFLDEIGELPLSLQSRLLLVLENSAVTKIGGKKSIKVDVRIIAATNKHLIDEIQEKRFRADLFYRLAGATLTLPRLTSRQGDLTLLIDNLLDKINHDEVGQTPSFTPRTLSAGARNKLLLHHWPGNIRELYFTLRRAVLVFSGGPVISAQNIEKSLLSKGPDTRNVFDSSMEPTLDEAIRKTVASRMIAAWQSTHSQTEAAEMLGIKRARFARMLKKYDIDLNSTN